MAHKTGDHVRLVSRNGLDHTRRFAEIAAAIVALPATTLILHGEVAIFDEQLVSRFEWLRHRDRAAVATPPIYMAFDVLQTGSQDLRGLPLRARVGKSLSNSWKANPSREATPRQRPGGVEAWAEVERRGHEGPVGKDEASPYVGGRTVSWLEVKQPDCRGFLPPPPSPTCI